MASRESKPHAPRKFSGTNALSVLAYGNEGSDTLVCALELPDSKERERFLCHTVRVTEAETIVLGALNTPPFVPLARIDRKNADAIKAAVTKAGREMCETAASLETTPEHWVIAICCVNGAGAFATMRVQRNTEELAWGVRKAGTGWGETTFPNLVNQSYLLANDCDEWTTVF